MQYEVRYRAGRAIGSLTIQSVSGTYPVALTSACVQTPPAYCSELVSISGNVESVSIAGVTVDLDDSARVQVQTDFQVDIAVYSTYVEVFEYEEEA